MAAEYNTNTTITAIFIITEIYCKERHCWAILQHSFNKPGCAVNNSAPKYIRNCSGQGFCCGRTPFAVINSRKEPGIRTNIKGFSYLIKIFAI
jgi:hypothetical protein